MKTIQFATLVLCLAFFACSKADEPEKKAAEESKPKVAESSTESAKQTPPATPSESPAIDLRVLPPMGFNGTYHTESTARFNNSLGGGGRTETQTEVKVLASSKDSVTATFDFKGSRKMTMNAVDAAPNYDGSRTCELKIARDGKIDTVRGKLPDEIPFSAPTFNRPLTIGQVVTDEDKTAGPGSGKAKIVRTRLKEIITSNGRRFADIEMVSEGDVSGTIETWVDLETGVIAKSSGRMLLLQTDGEEMTLVTSSWFIDSTGTRWIK